ncbi:Binding-protein-dependent transport systems inner membrane component [Mesorhizobium ventifaucium]|uniref:Binding-protein-dependent transport systems inner membrane component n=2 Tax=Mesorhizobium TaxID=68287 RepID=A0ABM9DQS4_9HYPH|nr:Binding-protein-dependent transport systems inner membrane component [Mesorhizobium ventifaucium]
MTGKPVIKAFSERTRRVADQTLPTSAWPANAAPSDLISPGRKRLGRALMAAATLGLLAVIAVQILYKTEVDTIGFETWRPVVYAYVLWGIALGVGQVLTRGEDGQRALFLLPALLFTIAMVIFPTLFGFYIALTDWNLSSFSGRKFNGLDNFWQMLADPYYRNALFNMVLYVLAVLVEYVIAFGLALLLNAQIRARKFFRVVFLLPLMLSPVAVSWMIGKSLMEYRFGPAATLARQLGWENPAFFSNPITARISIMVLDAWTFIPFMMIMLLAGLQAMSREVLEAARVDGANAWQTFWQVTFPLMLPVSVTAIILRIIFKLKLADIIITVTSGGPGGATDSVSSFIYREYRDRSNVGYGTMLAMAYLIIIIVFVTWLLKFANRFVRNVN